MRSSHRSLATAAAVALLVVACGKDSTGPSTPVDVTGQWSALGSVSVGGSIGFTLTLTQSGTSTTGTAFVQDGNHLLTVTGTVSGDKWTFQMTEPSPCTGSFSGSATVKTSMQGLFGGSDCLGAFTITFNASKSGQ